MTRPVPPAPRRKSIPRIARGPVGAAEALERATGEPAAPDDAAAAADGEVLAPPIRRITSLPDTRVLYGNRRSRLSTRRVRPAASAARTESTPPERTSMRRE